MGHFYFLLGLLALLLLSLGLSLHGRFGRRGRRPYLSAPTLFPPAEFAVLEALEAALGPGYRVFGRVRAVDVIGLRHRLDRPTRRRALMRLWAHRFDFLICTARDNRIAAALNLAPASRFGRPPPRDALDRICAAAGLPFVRIREADHYDPAVLAGLLRRAMRTRVRAPEGDHGRDRQARPAAPRTTPPPNPDQAPDAGTPPRPHPRPAPPAEPAPRIEPILAVVGDLEPGPDFRSPDFRIGAHLEDDDEDERPLRMRRR